MPVTAGFSHIHAEALTPHKELPYELIDKRRGVKKWIGSEYTYYVQAKIPAVAGLRLGTGK